jgi:hypothetical protein
VPKNRLQDLRDHLFEQLEALRDKDGQLDDEIKRPKAIAKLSTAIIETAKVEVRYAEAVGALPSGEFFEGPNKRPALTAPDPRRLA